MSQYFVFGCGCPAIAESESISMPTTTYTVGKADKTRYENSPLITFPTASRALCNGHQAVLDTLYTLEDGWDSYSAPAPHSETIDLAKSLLVELNRTGYAIEHVGPSMIGGVGITVDYAETEYAIEFRNSGKVVVTAIAENGDFMVHDLTEVPELVYGILSVLNKDAN